MDLLRHGNRNQNQAKGKRKLLNKVKDIKYEFFFLVSACDFIFILSVIYFQELYDFSHRL